MCGINGFNWSDPGLVAKMNQKVAHRGPDDTGAFVSAEMSLGHQRLAIIDLSAKGHQPMSFGKFTITYNGEIYNYLELKEELRNAGYKFQTASDTEVILAAYDKWRDQCVKRFNGIFAFAIWDQQRHELFVARDHLGIKPLYYYYRGEKFVFSSEIKGLLLHDFVPREIDPKALNFLTRVLYIPEPATMFAGIKRLQPGHYGYWRKGGFVETKYWDITDFQNSPATFTESQEQIRLLLRDAVKKQLLSDRPVGVFLSGGWDSSAVLGLMRELGQSQIQTFSSGFVARNSKYNVDVDLASQTAKFYQTQHHQFFMPPTEVPAVLEKVVHHLDEPNASPTALPIYYLSKFTSEKVAVLLGGDGGDELFAGYPRYTQSFYLSKFQKLPKWLRNQLVPYFLLELIWRKKDLRRKLNLPAGYERFAGFKVYPEQKMKRLLRPQWFDGPAVAEYFSRNYFFREDYPDFEKVLMYLDLKNWLPAESLWKTDHLTAAWGLEERLPLLDYRLVELSFKIPTSFKVKGGQGKWVFKAAVKQYVPPHLHNLKKRGWLTPGSMWLREELRPLMQEILHGSYTPELAEYFDLSYARELYAQHLAGSGQHLNQLWTILTFAIWHRNINRPDL